MNLQHLGEFKPAKNNKLLDPTKSKTYMQAEFIGQSLFSAQQYEHRSIDINGIPVWGDWAWTFTLAGIVVAVVAGAIAERASLVATISSSLVMAGFVFPVIARWHWNPEGWNSMTNVAGYTGRGPRVGHGCLDYAGSGVVHQTAGFAALAAAWLVGPRVAGAADAAEPHAPFVTLGTLLIWLAWYGFVPGAYKQIGGYNTVEVVSRTALLTTVGERAGPFSPAQAPTHAHARDLPLQLPPPGAWPTSSSGLW